MEKRARKRGVVRTAQHAAAQLLHARYGLDVAPYRSPPDVLAGESHVDCVAEEAVAKHLAELVLGLHDALHSSHADPPRGLEEVSFGT
jgi:hypothetical protein